MKKKNLLLGLFILPLTTTTMSAKAINTNTININNVTSGIETGDLVSKGANYLLNLIKTKGADFLTGTVVPLLGGVAVNAILTELGIGQYATMIEGFEKIESLCIQTQKQIKELDEKIQKLDDEKYINNILNQVNTFKLNEANAIDAISELIKYENNNLDEVTLNKYREEVYNNLIKDIKFDADSTNIEVAIQKLCENILKPNTSKEYVSIFDLYKNTLGTYQKWDYQSLKPTREFITYITSILLKGVLIATYDASYKIKGLEKDSPVRIAINNRINDMNEAFNDVMSLFKDKLIELDNLENKINTTNLIEYNYKDKKLTMYRKLAHLNVYNKENNAIFLLHEKENNKDYNSMEALHANENFYKIMFNDYNEVKDLYKLNINDFTFKDYVVNCGFDLGNLNNNVKGFYRGALIEDESIATHYSKVDYYDFIIPNKNNRVTFFKTYIDGNVLGELFFGSYDHVDQTIKEAFTYEYLCFVNKDMKLDGYYKETTIGTFTGVDGIGSDVIGGVINGGKYNKNEALKVKEAYFK